MLISVVLFDITERAGIDLDPIQLPDPAFQVSVISRLTEIILSPIFVCPK